MRYGLRILSSLCLAASPALALAQGPADLCGSVDFEGDFDPPCTDLPCGVDADGDGTGDDCFVTKYGFTDPADRFYRNADDDADVFRFDHESFEGSYILSRSGSGARCGPERSFTPLLGQVLLREQNDCVPTSDGPTCVGGTNEGQDCRWIDTDRDCPGGTCSPEGGCPVEIPYDLPGQENASTFTNGARLSTPAWVLLSSVSWSFSETSDPSDPLCQTRPENIRHHPSQGYRFNLPPSRVQDVLADEVDWSDDIGRCLDAEAGCTYVRFTGEAEKNLSRHDDNSSGCCNSVDNEFCTAIGFQEWPDLLRRDCGFANRNFDLFVTNDWLFDGDTSTGSAWGSFINDPIHEVEGAQQGLCRNNRFFWCEVGFEGAINPCDDAPCVDGACLGMGLPCTTDEECDLNDTCDTRERGSRSVRPTNLDILPQGNPDGVPDTPGPDCVSGLTIVKGTAGQYCHIVEQFALLGEGGIPSGSPGEDCSVWNFGALPLPDMDCDGDDDRLGPGGLGDLCPFLNENDWLADSDGDCTDGDPDTLCRGDECECGDQDRSEGGAGVLNILDILGLNRVIFGLEAKGAIAEATNDATIDVLDILRVNGEIFGIGSSVCPHVTRLGCGNGKLEPGEECDDNDGNAENFDGCDTACNVEPGWACTIPTGLCEDGTTECASDFGCEGIGANGICNIAVSSVCALIP